jgi:proton-dependent oligopeptide transporter, POT family
MSSISATDGLVGARETAETGHPKGLYVLFATEMWERFSFYSMLAMFTLYLRDPNEGFGWTGEQATSLYANYLMFVYASPLIGGYIADKFLGYRRAVMVGGLFFMAGHLLLSFPTLIAVYAALTCLVIGNGFFKPNVSTMVGNLYPDGSPLKDRAYNIFYMGINVGAAAAPIVMEIVKGAFGFHVAFAVAAFGMLISVWILWQFKRQVEDADRPKNAKGANVGPADAGKAPAPPSEMESVPEWKRIAALIVFLIVIVFWMVFHQNGSTLTYWADDNTDWQVSGIISNSINPVFIILLTFPLVWFWKQLSLRGMEPSTPTKMAIGMTLTGLSFFVMYFGAVQGESKAVDESAYSTASFRVTERSINALREQGMPAEVAANLSQKNEKGEYFIQGKKFSGATLKSLKDASTGSPSMALRSTATHTFSRSRRCG